MQIARRRCLKHDVSPTCLGVCLSNYTVGTFGMVKMPADIRNLQWKT